MTFDGLKSQPTIVCDSSVSLLNEITVFSRRQAVLAAVCDSTLIAILVTLGELGFMVLVNSIPVFERVVSNLVGMTVLLSLPVVAPLAFRLLWQVLRQRSSPGDKWLGICLDSERESLMIGIRKELSIGLLATTATVGMLSGCRAILAGMFSFDLVEAPDGIFFGAVLVLPIVYCLLLSLIKSQINLRSGRNKVLQLLPDEQLSLVRKIDHPPAHPRLFLALLMVPLSGYLIVALTAPSDVLRLVSSFSGKIILITQVFWLFWAQPIVRYSRSLRVMTIYSIVFVFPFFFWLLISRTFPFPR